MHVNGAEKQLLSMKIRMNASRLKESRRKNKILVVIVMSGIKIIKILQKIVQEAAHVHP